MISIDEANRIFQEISLTLTAEQYNKLTAYAKML